MRAALIRRRRRSLVDLTFITTWQTTTAAESITLPLISTGTYDFEVDWGDGSSDVITSFDDAARIHEYAEAGTRDVRISGRCEHWNFFDVATSKDKILDVKNWGSLLLGSAGTSAFRECSNLNVTAEDAPNLEGASIVAIFRGCGSLIGGAGFTLWDVSIITNLTQVFYLTQFNQDIGRWDVSNVTVMDNTLRDSSFNQDIGSWDVSNVTSMDNMFLNGVLSTPNYDALLIGWAAQDVQPNVSFRADPSKYSAAASDARDILTSAPNNWTITDGGLA